MRNSKHTSAIVTHDRVHTQSGKKPKELSAFLLLLLTVVVLCPASMQSTAAGKGKPPKDPPRALPTYTFRSLGTLGGTTSTANAINDFGDVVGNSQRADGSTGPYIFTTNHPALPAGMSDLQVYIETVLPGTEWVLKRVYDINTLGQIVGSGTYMGSKAAFRLTLPADAITAPVIENLGVPGTPTSINNDGDVAGHFADEDSIRHVFLWRPETGFIDLGVYAWEGAIANTYVTAINDRDAAGDIQVVGYARRNQIMSDDFFYLHAWRFETAFAAEGFQNLGLISGTNPHGASYCFDLNNVGEIAGYHKYESTDWQGFVYSDSVGLQNIGPIGGKASLAYGINDLGDVVGMTDTGNGKNNEHQAFVMTDEDGLFKLEPQIVDLPASMELLITPWRINSLGQIIGSGYAFPDQGVAFLITPL